MTKTFITDKDGATIDASTATVPSDNILETHGSSVVL